jgi:hypothetical protein
MTSWMADELIVGESSGSNERQFGPEDQLDSV